jgi:hypothetical protein
MHPLFAQASGLTHDVIGAAIEVHKDKGPGLLESIYEWCLTMELELRGHRVQNQDQVVVRYKQFQRQYPLRSICWSIAAFLLRLRRQTKYIPSTRRSCSAT